jgi:predicted O-methyltransferase YrrM
VSGLIAEQHLDEKVDFRFREKHEDYVAKANVFADESLDFCLVDGQHRDECAVRTVTKIRRGGLLVVDNIN